MPRALVGEELKNNALIFGYILLFPLVPTAPSPHPLLLTPRTNVEEHMVTWILFCMYAYYCMHTIYLTFLYACYLYAYYFVCILFILLFSFIKPFLQCTVSHQYYHLWLPEDETNLKLPGHFGIKAIR